MPERVDALFSTTEMADVFSIEAHVRGMLAFGEVSVFLSAMTQEHERAVGGWQAEWVALPNLFRYTSGAVEHVREMICGLKVDPARMSANVELTQGLIMAESLTMALASYREAKAFGDGK